jgi:lysophospholipase L1-like esterase
VVIGGGIPATSIRTPVILSALQIGAYGTAAALKGIIAHTKILDTTITQSQVRTELAAEQRLLASRRITLAQRPKLLLFDGDSISTGYVNIPTQDIFLSVVTSAMGRYGYSEINAAAGGQTAAQRAAAAPTNIAPIFSSPYGPIKKDYCVGEMGTNDLNAGDTAATTETNIAHWASLMTGLGCPVIYVTILPQCGKPASFETNRQLVNAWAARASVGKNATFRAIADVGNDPKMGRAGQCSNTTYYQDGTHPTATGHEVIAGYVENAIQDVDSLILGR